MELPEVTQARPRAQAQQPATVSARVASAPPWTFPWGFRLSRVTCRNPSARPGSIFVTKIPLAVENWWGRLERHSRGFRFTGIDSSILVFCSSLFSVFAV